MMDVEEILHYEKNYNDYIEFLKINNKSYNTLKEYNSIISLMLNFIKKSAKDMNYDDINRYLAYLTIDKKMAKASIYLHVIAIQSFLKFFNNDLYKKLNAPKRSKKLPTYLNSEEAHTLIEYSRKSRKGYAMICLLTYTGVRVSELCKLKIEDLDLNEGVIQIRSGKGDKDRIVVIEDKTIKALNDYLKERMKRHIVSDYLFYSIKNKDTPISSVTVERYIKKAAKESGIIKKVTPHVLRHTFATTLLKNGADIRFIQKILGHSNISTTELYTHIDNKALQDVYKRSKPKY